MVVGFLGDSNHTSMAQHVGVQPPPFVHLEYLPILARTLYTYLNVLALLGVPKSNDLNMPWLHSV